MYMNTHGFVTEKMLISVFLIIYKKVIIRDSIYDLGLSQYSRVKVLNHLYLLKPENKNETARSNLNIKCCAVIIFKMISY